MECGIERSGGQCHQGYGQQPGNGVGFQIAGKNVAQQDQIQLGNGNKSEKQSHGRYAEPNDFLKYAANYANQVPYKIFRGEENDQHQHDHGSDYQGLCHKMFSFLLKYCMNKHVFSIKSIICVALAVQQRIFIFRLISSEWSRKELKKFCQI